MPSHFKSNAAGSYREEFEEEGDDDLEENDEDEGPILGKQLTAVGHDGDVADRCRPRSAPPLDR